MGIGVVVHGFIQCPGHGHMAEARRLHRHNRRVIRSLPVSDPEWPFITRDMFNISSVRTSVERCVPQYENLLISFIGEYKNMYLLEAAWVEKFEQMLKRLCWDRAVVVAGFSQTSIEWSIGDSGLRDRLLASVPSPPDTWRRRAFRLDHVEVDLATVVDGDLGYANHRSRRPARSQCR